MAQNFIGSTGWNTGRQYSVHGQRMWAVFIRPEARVYFRDADRNIEGSVMVDDIADLINNEDDLRKVVMAAYDASVYNTEPYGTLAAVEDSIAQGLI